MAKNIVLKISEKGAKKTAGALKSVGGAVASIGKGAGIATVGLATLSTKLAGDFQKNLLEVSTLMDDNTVNLKKMSKELRGVASSSGLALSSISKAKYDIVSAGFSDAADSALVLKTASELAVGGVTSAAEAADLLTTALNAYGKSAEDVNEVSNTLFTTVKLGKTTMGELAGSLGRVLPFAKSLNLSLDGVGAAMATLTASGINTAEATTSLTSAITALSAPAESAKKAMDEAGIGVKRFDDGTVDLVSTIAQFRGLDPETIKKFVPNIRAIAGIQTMANNFSTLEDNVRDFQEAAKNQDATTKAFNKMTGAFNTQFAMLRNNIQNVMIEIGDVIIGIIQPALENLNKEFTEAGEIGFDNFGKAIKERLPVVIHLLKESMSLAFEFIAGKAQIMALSIKEHISDAMPFIDGDFEAIKKMSDDLAEKSSENAKKLQHLYTLAYNEIKERAIEMKEEGESAANSLEKGFEDLNDELEITPASFGEIRDAVSEIDILYKKLEEGKPEFVTLPELPEGTKGKYEQFPIDFFTGMQVAFSNTEERSQEFWENLGNGMQSGLETTSQISGAISGVFEAQYNHRKQLLDNQESDEIKQAQKSFETQKNNIIRQNTVNGQLTEQGKNLLRNLEESHGAETQNIKDKFQQKELELRKKMKPAKIAEAISNTALGVSKAIGSNIPPFNFAIAALVAAAGAMQVRTIQAQEFASGGIVQGNPAQGDVNPAMLTAGELILNQAQQENLVGGGGGITLNVSAPLVDETILDSIIPAIEKAQKMNLA